MEIVYPGLEKHWETVKIGMISHVLVPLCGKSRDLSWLSNQCDKVTGVEVSEIAVRSFFKEEGLDPEIRIFADFKIYSARNISIWCGDFFKLPAEKFGDIELIYDKAAMVAMPANKRKIYSDKFRDLTGNSVPILIHHFEYDQVEMNGPPFSVAPCEIMDLLGDGFKRIELENKRLDPNQFKKFKKRGLQSYFIEYLSLLLPLED